MKHFLTPSYMLKKQVRTNEFTMSRLSLTILCSVLVVAGQSFACAVAYASNRTQMAQMGTVIFSVESNWQRGLREECCFVHCARSQATFRESVSNRASMRFSVSTSAQDLLVGCKKKDQRTPIAPILNQSCVSPIAFNRGDGDCSLRLASHCEERLHRSHQSTRLPGGCRVSAIE